MSGNWSGGSWTIVESQTARTTISQAETNSATYTSGCCSGIVISTRKVSRDPLKVKVEQWI